MQLSSNTIQIFPLGDSALTIDFGNKIDEAVNDRVMALYTLLLNDPIPGTCEMVPAFSTLTLFYDSTAIRRKLATDRMPPGNNTAFDWVKSQLEIITEKPAIKTDRANRLVRIPVCYEKELAPDMEELMRYTGLTAAEIAAIHTGKHYRVFMLGFLPGFAYMGPLDDRISMPRKTKPRSITAGSVGIAGLQTGIYPLQSPGGWQIIGRTPLQLFNAGMEEVTLLSAGDTVEFFSIGLEAFHQIAARNY
jgi:inhibitor of KinA